MGLPAGVVLEGVEDAEKRTSLSTQAPRLRIRIDPSGSHHGLSGPAPVTPAIRWCSCEHRRGAEPGDHRPSHPILEVGPTDRVRKPTGEKIRSEEHTSELQSRE